MTEPQFSDEMSNAVTMEGTCPNCNFDLVIKTRVFNAAKPVALAYHGGVPGGFEGLPDDDAGRLRIYAHWLDTVDDATEQAYQAAPDEKYHDEKIGRDIQEDLRRIAERLESIDRG